MLYEPAEFEPLTDEPWDEGRVRDAIAAIVADADSAFDGAALWPVQGWDDFRDGRPLKVLYSGAAGVVWALDALRRRGQAESSLDLAAAALRALELERAEPDAAGDEHWRPGALIYGETGPILVALAMHESTGDAQARLPAVVHGCARHPHRLLGLPGRGARPRGRRARPAGRRAPRREGPRALPRDVRERLCAPQGVRAHRRRALAGGGAPLRRPRARPGGATRRRERPPPLLPLHRRRRHRALRGSLPRRRPALPDRRRHPSRLTGAPPRASLRRWSLRATC